MAVKNTDFLRPLQIKCIWNYSLCIAALQILNGLNFTAFLRSLQTGEFEIVLFVSLLQMYDGCGFPASLHSLLCLELFRLNRCTANVWWLEFYRIAWASYKKASLELFRLYRCSTNLCWLWSLPLFSVRYKEVVFGIVPFVPLHCKLLMIWILPVFSVRRKNVSLESFRLYCFCKFMMAVKFTKFTAFLHALQISWVWNCVVCSAALQVYDGCDFCRFSLFTTNNVC